MEQRIINFVHNNSWFEWEEQNEMFATRDHGNMNEEECGEEDYQEAIRLKKLLKETFPGAITYIDIETVDEWVTIQID